MKIDSLYIENFKSIESAQIKEIDNAFILVGKNNTGKSSVIDAVRAVLGEIRSVGTISVIIPEMS